jgi:tetratricopeptide (TPR) repeat protein
MPVPDIPEAPAGEGSDERYRAMAWSLAATRQAHAMHDAGDALRAIVLARCALALARQSEDAETQVEALMVLSLAEWALGGRIEQAYAQARDAEALARSGVSVVVHCAALLNCAMMSSETGDAGAAAQMNLRVVQLARSIRGTQLHKLIAIALVNLGGSLARMDLFSDAVAALRESVEAWEKLPNATAGLALTRNNLAECLLNEGRAREASGDILRAQAAYAEAVAALPLMNLGAWRHFTAHECGTLLTRNTVLCGLGRWSDARSTVAAALRIARSRRVPANFTLAHLAASQLHEGLGRHELSIGHAERVLALRAGNAEAMWIAEALARLARLYAGRGEFVRALACRKELDNIRTRQDVGINMLRCRLAAIERRRESRQRDMRESLDHTRRLAAIGRLIAEIQHALGSPLADVHRLCETALQAFDVPSTSAALAPLLGGVVGRLDQATALTQQLKLFSFRSAPQPMELSLHHAMEQARQGLAPHLPLDAAALTLRFQGDVYGTVWADPQRLGILFKVLLIELVDRVGHLVSTKAGALVLVHITRSQARRVLVSIDVPITDVAGARPGIGMALCAEIAREMNGELTGLHVSGGSACLRLELPQVSASAVPALALARNAD